LLTTVKCSEQNALFVSAIYSDLSLAPIEAATALRAQTVRSRRREVPAAIAAKLTRRELEDLRWVAQGKRYAFQFGFLIYFLLSSVP
jgi:hypothetical protein